MLPPMLPPLLLLASVSNTTGTAPPSRSTNWTVISPDFEARFAALLPRIPSTALATPTWSEHYSPDSGPVQVLSLALTATSQNIFCQNESNLATEWPRDAIRAGPSATCGVRGCMCRQGHACGIYGPWCYVNSLESCTDATIDQYGNFQSYLACSGSPDPDPSAWPEEPNVECARPNEGTYCIAARGPGSASNSIAISLVHGGYLGRMSARPGWVQYRFPAIPGAASFQLRFDLDHSWGYDLYGGNPCNAAVANSSHQCDICVSDQYGGWDYSSQPGFWVLWSASGRSHYIVSGPHAAPTQADGKGLLDSPPDLDLQDGEELVVVFMVYSQYSGWRELVQGVDRFSSGSCTQELSHGNSRDPHSYALIIEKVEVVSRGRFAPPEGPAMQNETTDLDLVATVHSDYSPNLFGTDSEWINNTMVPFFSQQCDSDASPFSYGGVTGGEGVASFKAVFELAVLGYSECAPGRYNTPPATIDTHPVAELYFRTPVETIRIHDKQKALHLLRRMHACHRGVPEALDESGNCQFTLADTVRFREAVISREMGVDWGHANQGMADDFGTPLGVWWWEFPWQGAGGYDFKTSETVAFFSLFIDTLRPYLSVENITAIESQMEPRIDHFLSIFNEGRWPLWNGNNWTPSMCVGAAYWSIVYWNRESGKAHTVLRAIYDILWWHRKMYTDEPSPFMESRENVHASENAIFNSTRGSVYVEGLSYSAVSSGDLFKLADVLRPAFGELPPSITAFTDRLTAAASWMFWMTSTDSFQVPFGDSHPRLGYQNILLRAMMAKEALWNPSTNSTAETRSQAMTEALSTSRACTIRRFFTAARYQHPIGNPFTFPPELSKNWTEIVSACTELEDDYADSHYSGQPLGTSEDAVYTVGGYAAFRSPLLPLNFSAERCATNGTDTLCFQPSDDPLAWSTHGSRAGFGCLSRSTAYVTMADATPYSFLAIQAKDAKKPHTERDFGTIIWSAWGTRFLSEFGYGTISTGEVANEFDVRRLANVDNNPAGHNTLIIRQANPEFPLPAEPGSGSWGTENEVTFSQFNYEHGPITRVRGIFGQDCVDLDAGPVYGSERVNRDGWFDAFHRYACPLAGGHFLLLDAFSVMANRSRLRLGYDYHIPGPYFDEDQSDGTPGPNERLDVDTYFHAPTTSALVSVFNRTESPPSRSGFCEGHVDLEIMGATNASVRLTSICGQGSNRGADGMATVTGWSLRGGGFVHDGLVSAHDHRGDSIYTRRFRWQGDSPIDTSGDVRVYVLASAPAIGSTVASCRRSEASVTPSNDAPTADRLNIHIADQYTTPNRTMRDALTDAASAITNSGDPLSWVAACPADLSQSVVEGCPTSIPSQSCICAEVCAGGLLYWVRFNGASANNSRGANIRMSQIAWVGSCTQLDAIRSRLHAARQDTVDSTTASDTRDSAADSGVGGSADDSGTPVSVIIGAAVGGLITISALIVVGVRARRRTSRGDMSQRHESTDVSVATGRTVDNPIYHDASSQANTSK